MIETLNPSGVCNSVNAYNANWSAKAYFGYASTGSAEYTLPSTAVLRINSITDTGFIMNRTNTAATYQKMRYVCIE